MTNNLNIPPKISIEGKPKYINIGDEHNFFELLEKLKEILLTAFYLSPWEKKVISLAITF